MSDLNQVTISGRLTRDPVARGGGSVAALSVASNRQYQRNGEWVEEVVYVDVTAFGHNASRCIERLIKGAPVTVAGRLELNSYQNAEGEKRSQLRIVANQILSPAFSKRSGESSEATEELPTSAAAQAAPPEGELVAANGVPVEDDDIPF